MPPLTKFKSVTDGAEGVNRVKGFPRANLTQKRKDELLRCKIVAQVSMWIDDLGFTIISPWENITNTDSNRCQGLRIKDHKGFLRMTPTYFNDAEKSR